MSPTTLRPTFFGELPSDYDPATLVQKGMDAEGTLAALRKRQWATWKAARRTTDSDTRSWKKCWGKRAQRLELSRRQFFGLLRTAATGRNVSPPLFETMEVMGRERVLARLRLAVEKLGGTA